MEANVRNDIATLRDFLIEKYPDSRGCLKDSREGCEFTKKVVIQIIDKFFDDSDFRKLRFVELGGDELSEEISIWLGVQP